MKFALIFILLWSNQAAAAYFDCLLAGSPGNIQNKRCQPLDPENYKKNKKLNCVKPDEEVLCNPVIFGNKICLEKGASSTGEIEQLSACKKKSPMTSEVALGLVKGTDAYNDFDSFIQELKVLCDPDVGEVKWADRCKIIFVMALQIEKELDKKEGGAAGPSRSPSVLPESFEPLNDVLKALKGEKDKKKKMGEKKIPDIIYDFSGKRDLLRRSDSEVKEAQASILPMICDKSYKKLTPFDFETFFELTYSLFISNKFEKDTQSDKKEIFCFLKKEIELYLNNDKNPLRLIELLSHVSAKEKWDCPL